MPTKLPDLRLIAVAAFIVGVTLHACVAFAVLGSGGGPSSSSSGGSSGPSAPATTATQRAGGPPPTPTRLPDRTACADIRGTDYRSDTERLWFLQNCSGGSAPGRLSLPALASRWRPVA